MRTADEVLKFWFEDHGNDDWFGGDPEFDRLLDREFRKTHEALSRGEGWLWRATPPGRLAEIIVLDQFSRQLHRGTAAAFAQDGMALVLAQELVMAGLDRDMTEQQRIFAYMPYMHSESLLVHEEAVRLFRSTGNENVIAFEMRHVELLRRFGRYPKRNAALGRESTPEERDYIAEKPNEFF